MYFYFLFWMRLIAINRCPALIINLKHVNTKMPLIYSDTVKLDSPEHNFTLVKIKSGSSKLTLKLQ